MRICLWDPKSIDLSINFNHKDEWISWASSLQTDFKMSSDSSNVFFHDLHFSESSVFQSFWKEKGLIRTEKKKKERHRPSCSMTLRFCALTACTRTEDHPRQGVKPTSVIAPVCVCPVTTCRWGASPGLLSVCVCGHNQRLPHDFSFFYESARRLSAGLPRLSNQPLRRPPTSPPPPLTVHLTAYVIFYMNFSFFLF